MELSNNELIIVGGAEKKKGNAEILEMVVKKLNKEKDTLVIFTVASEIPNIVGDNYLKVFKNLGVKNLKKLNINNRKETMIKENIETIKMAKAIFFTGGDQLRITSFLGGTEICKIIKNSKNKIIIGTSAGASIMSETMIVGGEDEESPRKNIISMAPGFGLLKDTVIDQHFAQRGRIGRLLTCIAENPEVLGIGIDEDTAMIVQKDIIKIVGSGAVYIIDGSNIIHTNSSEKDINNTLSIFNIKLHVLTSGDIYSLKDKTPFEKIK